jgi:transposase
MSGQERTAAKIGQGKVFNSQSRMLIKRLCDYFRREADNNGPLIPFRQITQRVANALQINRSTVSKISNETIIETPGKHRTLPSPKSGLDSFSEDAIRRHVYAYYEKKELPTLMKLKKTLEEDNIFNGSDFTLRKILKKLGFRWKKINNRQFLMERNDIVNWRCNFLRSIWKEDLNKVVFLDETWINAGHTVKNTWTDGTLQSSRKEPTGKGGRLIIIHAGSSSGFVPNCLEIFQSKKTSDYHEEMNSTKFKEWFLKLLNNIEPGSTIVMDNAPYHSVQLNKAPTQASTKMMICEWLQRNEIPFENALRKSELLEIVKKNSDGTRKYEIDELAKERGHKVIRQPPYHCHFNPIELIWANIKGKVASRNKTFTIKEVEKLTHDAVNEISIQDWANAVNHVGKIIQESWEKDVMVEESVDQLIISLGQGETSSDEESDDSDDEFNRDIRPLPSDSDSD